MFYLPREGSLFYKGKKIWQIAKKLYHSIWQIAKKLYHYLANGQKIIPLFGNWTYCQMSPENWQNVARKFSGDILTICKK
jgi:phosphoheptose isomerase